MLYSLVLILCSSLATSVLSPAPASSSSAGKPLTLFSTASANGEKPNLPPGRKTPRFLSFLFDDTLRLLNPKSMGSYQVRRTKEYGEVFKTNIFGRPTLFATGESSLAELGKEEARGSMEAFFPPHHQKLFGPQSLLVQSGDTHKLLRGLIQPILSPSVMTSLYRPTILESIDQLLEEMKSNKGYFEAVPKLRTFFVSIALQILLGESIPVPEGLTADLTIWSKGLLSAPLTFIPWSTAAKAVRARKRICATMEPLLEQERKKPSNSLLGRFVESRDENGNSLSNSDILDNVLTLIFAGSDTTASAATSLILALSLQPELKADLRANPDKADAVVQQVLASYPPAPFSMRLSKEPVSIQNYHIPAGWLVVYGFAGALAGGRDNQLNALTKVSTEATGSLAFGAGPRMCPGRYLAAMELVILCNKLIECDWDLKEDQKLVQTYTPGFFPKDGLQIRFH